MNDAPILICFDGSADAVRAIETSAELLGPHRAVVLDIGPPISPEESLATLAPVVQLNASQAGQVAARGAEIARASGFDAEARAAVAAPTWQGIVDVAHELDVPLIVIGSRGLSGLKEMIDGSLSHQVAEHAGRPVLITPPPNGS